MRTKIIFLILIISFLTNGLLFYKVLQKNTFELNKYENFPFLSKRIFIENQNDILINFIPLRSALKEYVEAQNGNVGVYFEYLPSGTSIGVNDKEEIKIASLSKVPMVMSIFKKIERGEINLKDILTVEKKHLNQEFGNLWKRGEGTKISIEELIQLSLVESDNTAYNILSDQLTDKEISEVYDGLDIPLGKETKGGEIYILISPKNYSSIFRSLYLSSFLSEESSNSILDILTQTTYNNKIVAGVPPNIKVAHKIGVFEKKNNENLFSDCGIIYSTQRPYILCIFVQDTNIQAQKHMSYISKMIYTYIDITKK